MKIELSKRQTQVLEWVTRGATNAQVAKRLGLSESTVKLHMTKILKKYGARSRPQLIISVLKGLSPGEIPDFIGVEPKDKPFGWVLLKGNRLVGLVLGKQPSAEWLPIYLGKAISSGGE